MMGYYEAPLGFLIPVEWLVNGRSITLATMDYCEAIDYFHIELETHEVVFAEGAPAETLLVTSDREGFANFVEYERMYGAERPPMKPFAPTIYYKGARGEVERLLRKAVSPVADRLGLVGNDYLLSNESRALDRIRFLRTALLPAPLLVRSRS
jgi:hypothetical protein